MTSAAESVHALDMKGRVHIHPKQDSDRREQWRISIPLEGVHPAFRGIRRVLGDVARTPGGYTSSYHRVDGVKTPPAFHAEAWQAVHALLLEGSTDRQQALNTDTMTRTEMNAAQRKYLRQLADELEQTHEPPQ